MKSFLKFIMYELNPTIVPPILDHYSNPVEPTMLYLFVWTIKSKIMFFYGSHTYFKKSFLSATPSLPKKLFGGFRISAGN